jgi:hypothetical protein
VIYLTSMLVFLIFFLACNTFMLVSVVLATLFYACTCSTGWFTNFECNWFFMHVAMYYVTSCVSLKTSNLIDWFFFHACTYTSCVTCVSWQLFLFHMRVYFELPLVANLSHVRNIFLNHHACIRTKEGQPASMLSQDYEIRRIFLSISSLFSKFF